LFTGIDEWQLLPGIKESNRAARVRVVVPQVRSAGLELLPDLRMDDRHIFNGLLDAFMRQERAPALGILRIKDCSYLIQNSPIFQSPGLDLTTPCRKSKISGCIVSQLNRGDVAAGSRLRRDHEVEVPPCERGANPGRQAPGENRMDQRMPLEFVTDSFSPFRNKRTE